MPEWDRRGLESTEKVHPPLADQGWLTNHLICSRRGIFNRNPFALQKTPVGLGIITENNFYSLEKRKQKISTSL